MSDAVLTETRGRVLLITLNRPEAMNAINTDLAQGLLAAVAQLDGDDGLTAGVLTGAGRGFCAGMDLKAFATSGPPVGMDQFIEKGAQKPLIAAIEGFALAGGLELALACDLLVAAENVKLGIPEAGVGLFAAGGAVFRLPRWVPYAVAMEMALTADPITAQQAKDYGLAVAGHGEGQGHRHRPRAGRTDRQERPAVGGGEQDDRPQHPGHDRRGGLGVPEAVRALGVHVRGRQRGPQGLRREARPGLERAMSGS